MRPLCCDSAAMQLADACCIRYTEIANMKKTKSQFEQEAGVAMHLLDPFGVPEGARRIDPRGARFQVHAECQSLSEQLQWAWPVGSVWHDFCACSSPCTLVDIPNMSQPWANRAALLSRWLKDCLEISHPTACHAADGSSCSWCWSHRTWRRNLFDLGEVTWLRYSLLHPFQFFPPSFGH